MSGGSFNYAYKKVEDFAYLLSEKISSNKTKDRWGCAYDFRDEVIAKMVEIEGQARKTAKLMREVEWLYSGDHGSDSFLALVKKIEQE